MNNCLVCDVYKMIYKRSGSREHVVRELRHLVLLSDNITRHGHEKDGIGKEGIRSVL